LETVTFSICSARLFYPLSALIGFSSAALGQNGRIEFEFANKLRIYQ
jgi:hypothetical protein